MVQHGRGQRPREPVGVIVEFALALCKSLIPHGRPNRDFAARASIHRSSTQSCALRGAPLTRYNRDYVTQKCRAAMDQLRVNIRQGKGQLLNDDTIFDQVEAQIELESRPGHIRVVNATGTILHTNLGRALLSQAADRRDRRGGRPPVNLEYDLAAGERGEREETLEQLFVNLTGAEAATVVNNNAAAVLLVAEHLGPGQRSDRLARRADRDRRRLSHSRDHGQERRDPARSRHDQSHPSGGLRERHQRQHRAAAEGPHQQLQSRRLHRRSRLWRVVAIGRQHHLPVMEDLGSGALIDLSLYGLPKEPLVGERIAAGADVVTFSGDKILGGPQAGLMVGRSDLIGRMNKNPSATRPALRQADARRPRSDAAPLPPVARHRRRDSDAASLHPLHRRSPRHGPVGSAEAQRTALGDGLSAVIAKTRHRRSAAAPCRRKNCRRWSSPSRTRNAAPTPSPINFDSRSANHRPHPRRRFPSRPKNDLRRQRPSSTVSNDVGL